MVDADQVLRFLKEWRTRKEIEQKFGLSNTSSYNLIRWLLKSKLVESWQIREAGRTNRVWYYRTIKKKYVEK